MSTLEAQLNLIAKPPPRARARSRAALLDPESAAMWRHHLDIETGPVGSIAVLHMAGDIDMLTLPLVRAALITALDTRPADLWVPRTVSQPLISAFTAGRPEHHRPRANPA
jgi:hypothetical protein